MIQTEKLARSLTLALLAAIAACGKSEPKVAVVNGEKITQAQWTGYLKFKRIKAEDAVHTKSALSEYLQREALADVIGHEKVLDTDAIRAEMREFEKEMLISRYFEKYLDQQVTDKAIQNYYDSHASSYEEKKVHVAHILFRLNGKMSEEERRARLTAAQSAYSQLHTGKDFAEVAKNLSEDKVSSGSGGDLGWLREGSIDPAFSRKAFSLAVGEVSEPFESPFGFHLIKVLEAPQMVKKPLRAVQGDIRYQLRAEAKTAEMARLLGKTKIEVDGKPFDPHATPGKPETKVAERK
jgi:peptidyl-prolyl cis-trans isomerase C